MADPHSLERFVEAQCSTYAAALGEIRCGAKRSHWMWFIFPQLAGLGQSPASQFYGIRSAHEARDYLDHRLLGPRYGECVEALQALGESDAVAVFGSTDALKLRSSLSLFDSVRPYPLAAAALERWFGGKRDPATLRLLGRGNQ